MCKADREVQVSLLHALRTCRPSIYAGFKNTPWDHKIGVSAYDLIVLISDVQ